MKVKPFLKRVRESFLEVQVLCAQAEKYREMATRAGGGNRKGESLEPCVVELMDVHAKLQSKVSELLSDTRAAEKMIETLEKGSHRAVLNLYYICGYSFADIANETNYTLRWVHKLHVAGVAELERRYTE